MSIPKLNDSATLLNHNNSNNQSSIGSKMSKKELRSLTPIIVLISILAVAVGVLGFLYWDSKQENQELKSQQNVDATSKEYQEVVDAVKSLVEIPEDERLNVAKVDNPETLKEQNAEFYKNVEVGQYLVVMPKTQRVLIYDKAKNKVVNFSSYTIKVELIPENEIDASEKPLTIEIRYTSDVTQETLTQVQNALKEASANYSIISTSKTTATTEGLTVVLLNREKKPKMSQNIIAHSGTNSITDKLPEGEASSTADVVLILGKVAQTGQ